MVWWFSFCLGSLGYIELEDRLSRMVHEWPHSLSTGAPGFSSMYLSSFSRLDLFSDPRAALQETESRSCKVSSGLPLGGHIRSFLPCLEHSQSMSSASSDSRSREKDPNSWCEEWQSQIAREPGHKQGMAHQGLLP